VYFMSRNQHISQPKKLDNCDHWFKKTIHYPGSNDENYSLMDFTYSPWSWWPPLDSSAGLDSRR
jgi:hypothetical protein